GLEANCLEFGTPWIYRYSWMSVGDLKLSKVHVKAEIKMTLGSPYPTSDYAPFMGIMVRGHHYYANLGHLIFVRKDGKVYLTMIENSKGKYHEERIGKIPNFNMKQFSYFDIIMNDKFLKIKVNDLSINKKLTELPHVFTTGTIIFIAGYCRIGIRNIEVEEL
ncbi:MAG: hypothetical protein KAV48_01245, partial [Methanomicrobia archaeon]|nr:hypothetical protein [Methanomicrobia archaeon]